MAPKKYLIMEGKGYITLKLLDIFEFQDLKKLQEDLSPFLIDPLPHVIVNCESVQTLSLDLLRELIKIQNTLKSQDKKLRMLQMNTVLRRDLRKLGLDGAFVPSLTLREALADFGPVGKKMLDTNFINPFLTATLHVISVQANIKAEAGTIFMRKPTDIHVGDISGIISIVSEAFTGSMVISFPEKTFLGIMSAMLAEEFTELNQEIIDGAGEITNMIFGQAKVVLNERGYGIKTALPTVVTGKNHSLSSLTKEPVMVVPFKSPVGDFFVEVCLSA